MRGLLPGCLAFLLFFLSDWNDWRGKKRGLRWSFPAGTILLAGNLLILSLRGKPPVHGVVRVFFSVLAAVMAGLLFYSLFFALPLKESYGAPGQERRACTSGVYALCRHPGVLWLAGGLICLWPAAGLSPAAVVLYTVLNILLVTFEDRLVFPALLTGYDEYRKVTPFLIPGRASIQACFRKR